MPDIMDEEILKKILPNKDTKAPLLGSKISNNLSHQQKQQSPYILPIDSLRCRPWKYHDRDLAWLTGENCKDLIDSIKKHGQLEPALVRKIKGSPDFDYEIIYGVRRWFACSQIPNQKFLVNVTEKDDKTCMVLMHTENAESKNITEFERAFSFAQQMKSGLFTSQNEMAEMMGLSQSHVSKLINAGMIFEYPWIKELFQNKIHIPLKYAYELSVLLKQPSFHECIKLEADTIQTEKEKTGTLPSAAQVLKRLIKITKPLKLEKEKVIFKNVDQPIAFYSKNKSGEFSLFIKKRSKAT